MQANQPSRLSYRGRASTHPGSNSQQLYQPLAPWQIRLLRIHQASNLEDPIICDLLIADLITFEGAGLVREGIIIRYEALSYSWGYPKLNKVVECNGTQLPVSETMYDALRHLRHPDSDRYLWTDVCCINQNDLDEKTIQVRMMYTIFQKAFRVVAWLGTPSAEDELLFKLIEATDEYDRVDTFIYDLGGQSSSHPYDYDRYDANFGVVRKAAWNLVTRRPFFRRTWIRQEFFAAREMSIFCGKFVCDFPRFNNVMDQLLPDETSERKKFTNKTDPESRALLCYSYFRNDFETSIKHQTRSSNDVWFNTMMRSTVYESTLPQDKIFAVLGITAELTKTEAEPRMQIEANDITEGLPAIDYKKSVSLVYQDFTKHTINTLKDLTCLSIFFDISKNQKDIPSWAIDLRIDTPRYLIPQQMAGWEQDFSHEMEEQDFTQHDILRLRGKRLAKIGPAPTPNPWTDNYPRQSMGDSSPMLKSCLADNEEWFPEEDEDEDDEDSNKTTADIMLDRAWRRLANDCNYTWKTLKSIEPKTQIAPTSHYAYDWDKDGKTPFTYHVFASSMVQDGDVVVHLNGAERAFVLRKNVGARGFRFLGPCLLVVGCFGRESAKRPAALRTFQYAMAHVEGQRDAGGDEFVLT